MSRKVHFAYKEDSWELERTVFQYGHTESHLPRVIIVAAMHGNEPSGLRALLELKPILREASARMKGMVCGLIGNFRALEHGSRFIDKDLNRMWKQNGNSADCAETQEKNELNALISDVLAGDGPRYVLDLHTTSSESAPFMSIADTRENRLFASNFDIPAIAGIERFIKGALLEHVSNMGHVGLAFEAGQHIAADSVDHHEDFILQSLHYAGVLSDARHASPKEGLEYDIIFRHPIQAGDEFVMNPGYHNFSPVHKGQILAHDRHGEIRAEKAGLLFMPLYQSRGDDGFFIVR